MKAAVYENYGPPAVLQIKEVAKPAPKDQELLIRVYATTVNRTDCSILRARPFVMRFVTGLLKPTKPIPGTDFAGMVEAVGKEVVSFKVGDRVFGFDDTGLSSQAQYMTIPEDQAMTTMSDTLSYEQAAASLEGVHYAYNFLNKVDLHKGQKVLVNGATGAIGSAAVQLLKYHNIQVTAVCGPENIDLVQSLGADKVLDYTKEDFTRSLEKYDYVFDAVGKSSFRKCWRILKPGGVYISSELGWMSQNIFLALITPLTAKFSGRLLSKKVIFPIPFDRKASVFFIKKLIGEGKFKALIDRNYPLEEIADAYSYVLTGEKTGNVVISYGHND